MEPTPPIPDDRYLVAQIVQLEKHMPLRYQDLYSQEVAPQTGDVEAESIILLCENIGQTVILMIHSAAAAYVEPLLKARPELFKAVINLEQAFIAVDDEKETVNAFAALLDGKLFLSVYADYIEERGQTNRVILSQAITDSIIQQGGVAGFIYLPQKEILGNTHLMMQVNNNDVISDKIINWFRANVPFEPDVPTEHIVK